MLTEPASQLRSRALIFYNEKGFEASASENATLFKQ